MDWIEITLYATGYGSVAFFITMPLWMTALFIYGIIDADKRNSTTQGR